MAHSEVFFGGEFGDFIGVCWQVGRREMDTDMRRRYVLLLVVRVLPRVVGFGWILVFQPLEVCTVRCDGFLLLKPQSHLLSVVTVIAGMVSLLSKVFMQSFGGLGIVAIGTP
jgi:hypothetical protein